MGQIQTSYDWDWAGAEASLTRALELAPGNSHILAEMAVLQRFIGNLDVAIELNRRAVELDPLDMRGYHQLGLALIWAEQLDEALAVYHQLLRLNPEYTSANLSLSRILLLQGNLEGAMAAAEREREPFWREFGILINLYAQGNTEEADVRLVDFIEQNQADSAYQIATIYGFRGDIDQVFEWLELAYIQRDGGLPEMLSDPFLNQFSNDPRWVEILKKVGLYEAWLRAQA
jgi:tetratricopeptide (TPR) repeat protein